MKLYDVIIGSNWEKAPSCWSGDQQKVILGAEECEGNPGEERRGERDSMYEQA